MIRISNVYKFFGWIHTNSIIIPTWIGKLVTLGMFLLANKKLKIMYQEYKTYSEKITPKTFNWYTYLGCHVIYGASIEDYYVYGFDKLNDKGRREYITDIGAYNYFRVFNKSIFLETFRNKYQTYIKYKPYFKRDIILIDRYTDDSVIQRFLDTNKFFILKPLMLSCGKGIEKKSGGGGVSLQ